MKYIFRFNTPLYKSYPDKYYKNLARLLKIRNLFAKNLNFSKFPSCQAWFSGFQFPAEILPDPGIEGFESKKEKELQEVWSSSSEIFYCETEVSFPVPTVNVNIGIRIRLERY
jgi:hypothetical protein